MKVNKLTTLGILSALAVALSAIDSVFTPLLPLGIHIGLAYIVIMFCIIKIDTKSAFIIVFIKVLFVFITRGTTAFMMSVVGSFLSLVIIYLCLKKFNASVFLSCVMGAISHNLGQLISAIIITQNISTAYYSFILIIGGILSGIFTGFILNVILNSLKNINFNIK